MQAERKIVVLLGDGMADLPLEDYGNRTILEIAHTPNMDYMASKGINGMARTVPQGMNPGSDTANLSVFGYDPEIYYTGRAPLEAINMGIELSPSDVAFRCNIVTTEGGKMTNFTADHIDSNLSKVVMDELSEKIDEENIEFYPGVSYRNIMVWRNFPYESVTSTTPPHDIQDRLIKPFLPEGEGEKILTNFMERSREIIASSEKINSAKKQFQGQPESIWIWGGGRRPAMETLEKRFGLKGYTISAVDLIHGIGRAAGLEPLRVPHVTGYIDTNYEGKANALKENIEKANYIFLHIESPDESGHEGSFEHKIKAIEDFDKKIVGPVMEEMQRFKDFAILLMPDHPTPIKIKTHTADPVPFLVYSRNIFPDLDVKKYNAPNFCESSARATGLKIERAHEIIELLMGNKD